MAVDIPTLVVATALYLAATIALGYFAYRQTKTS